MHYYIDGYNLMFRVLRAGDDLQGQREKTIRDLNAKIQLLNLKATVVFDAQYQYGGPQRSHFKELEILFTAQGETADEYILRALKSAPKPEQCTVVTSDKRLAWAARRRLAKTESVEEFLAWLNKRFHNKIRRLKDADSNKPLKAVSLPKKAIKRDIEPVETIEERFEYYLKIFEGELRDSRVKEKETNHLSDMERWLKAFEDPEN